MFLMVTEDACITVVGWSVETIDFYHGKLCHEPRGKKRLLNRKRHLAGIFCIIHHFVYG